jgi:hypothetical protein
MHAVTQTSTVLVRGLQDASQEGLNVFREQLQRTVNGERVVGRVYQVEGGPGEGLWFCRQSKSNSSPKKDLRFL